MGCKVQGLRMGRENSQRGAKNEKQLITVISGEGSEEPDYDAVFLCVEEPQAAEILSNIEKSVSFTSSTTLYFGLDAEGYTALGIDGHLIALQKHPVVAESLSAAPESSGGSPGVHSSLKPALLSENLD